MISSKTDGFIKSEIYLLKVEKKQILLGCYVFIHDTLFFLLQRSKSKNNDLTNTMKHQCQNMKACDIWK